VIAVALKRHVTPSKTHTLMKMRERERERERERDTPERRRIWLRLINIGTDFVIQNCKACLNAKHIPIMVFIYSTSKQKCLGLPRL
jgi:hypothetical protein